MKKILLAFGTRPEAIKMAPLYKALKQKKELFDTRICVTAQHRQMLDQVLDFFKIVPEYDLDLMRANQSLNTIWADILVKIRPIIEEWQPDWVLVHGDTATSAAVALAAYFAHCKVGHIEAGLRTWNKWSPFPEEMNRQLTGRIADFHFAPTIQSRNNLIKESIPANSIQVTGNTVIDALYESVKEVTAASYDNGEIDSLKQILHSDKKIVLVTGHRRENFGQGFINICQAIRQIAESRPDIQIVYPVHLNPNVSEPVHKLLEGIANVHLIPPLSYPSFVWIMNQSHIILTDSGGVQEEAPSLGKPVLVMRDTTERPEAVEAGTVILVGTDKGKIVDNVLDLLANTDRYAAMSRIENPYGDGHACKRISEILMKL